MSDNNEMTGEKEKPTNNTYDDYNVVSYDMEEIEIETNKYAMQCMSTWMANRILLHYIQQ